MQTNTHTHSHSLQQSTISFALCVLGLVIGIGRAWVSRLCLPQPQQQQRQRQQCCADWRECMFNVWVGDVGCGWASGFEVAVCKYQPNVIIKENYPLVFQIVVNIFPFIFSNTYIFVCMHRVITSHKTRLVWPGLDFPFLFLINSLHTLDLVFHGPLSCSAAILLVSRSNKLKLLYRFLLLYLSLSDACQYKNIEWCL